jgi:hypothetical protein
MKINFGWLAQIIACAGICGMVIAGLVENVHTVIDPSTIDVEIEGETVKIAIAGMRLSSSHVSLEYNYCEGDAENADNTRLFSAEGFAITELAEDGSRDQSVVEFAHMNVHEDGVEILGDINVVPGRARFAKSMAVISVVLFCISLLLSVVGIQPVSLASQAHFGARAPQESEKFAHIVVYLGQFLTGTLFVASVCLWYSMVIIGSITTILLGHLFREARDRCQIDFATNVTNVSNDGHHELRTLGRFMRDKAFPTGFTHSLYSTTIISALVVLAAVFVIQNSGVMVYLRDWRSFRFAPPGISTYKFRSLSWFNKIWHWSIAVVVFILSVYTLFVVGNASRIRGYQLNMFHWGKGSAEFSSVSGLSQTGTLLDYAQGVFHTISISEWYVFYNVYAWLSVIPLIAICSRHFGYFCSKVMQDFSILFFLKALISYVTLAPTSISMLERPECFEDPAAVSVASWTPHNACNDTMFSIHAITVMGSVSVLFFYFRFGDGMSHSMVQKVLIYSAVIWAAVMTLLMVIMSRHQYSADVHVGACIAVLFMLTQSHAYKVLIQNDDHKSQLNLKEYIQQKLIPTIHECATRMESYNTAVIGLPGLKASDDEIDELEAIYRSVGAAIQRVKDASKTPSAITMDNKKDK